MNAGRRKWLTFLSNRRVSCRIALWNHSKKSFIFLRTPLAKDEHGGKSCTRRFLSLVGWAGFRQLLRSLSRRSSLVVGNILAGGRHLQLDHRTVVLGKPHDARSTRRLIGGSNQHPVLVVLLRASLGHWRADLRPYDALPWSFPGHGRCPWSVRRLRHLDASHLQRRVCQPGPWDKLRTSDFIWHLRLLAGDCRRRSGRHLQGTRHVAGRAEGRYSGIRPEERPCRCDLVWGDECVLRLWTSGGRADQGPNSEARHSHPVARITRAGRRADRRICDQLPLVSCAQHS